MEPYSVYCMLYAGLLFFFFDFVRVVIGTGFVAASHGNGLGAFHHESAAEFAMVSGWARFNRMLAFRVV